MSADLAPVVLDSTEARALTDQIKTGVDAVWHLVQRAYIERAWSVLGYSSWDDYCTREFGTSRLRLPREERAEVVSSLRESGLSIRAIASATRMGKQTVQNELNSHVLSKDTSSEPVDDEDALTEELLAAEPESKLAPVVGLDGKRYQPKPPPTPATPRREPLPDTFAKVTVQLSKLATQIESLCTDDRFAKNKDQIALRVSDLVRARDALHRVIDKFN